MSDSIEELVKKVGAHYNADLYLHIGGMETGSDDLFNFFIKKNKKKDNALLIIRTRGGIPDVAYKIARSFQYFYDIEKKDGQDKKTGEFFVFIASECKSAGTLLAIGANKIIMNHKSELGPLDVQLRKADEVGERTSGLAPFQAMTSLKNQSMDHFQDLFHFLRYRLELSTKISTEVAVSLTAGLLSPIYAQLDPIRMGEIERSLSIASAYGERLSTRSKSLKADALGRLLARYPSHGFVIDKDEASELSDKVEAPIPELESLSEFFCSFTQKAFSGEDKPFSIPLESKDETPPTEGGSDEQRASQADTGNPGEAEPGDAPAGDPGDE